MGEPISTKLSFWDKITDILTTLLYLSFTVLATDVTGVYSMVGLTVLIYFIYIVRTFDFNLHLGMFQLYMSTWGCFALLSYFWAIIPDYAIEKGVTILELLVVFMLLYSVYYKASIERLLKIIMWAGLVLGVYSLAFYGISGLEDTISDGGRLENSFANVNVVGMACSTSVLICIFFFRFQKNIVSLICAAPAILIIAGSGSRKALLMLLIGLAVIFFFQYQPENKKKSKGSKFIKYIASIAVMVVVIIAVAQTGVFDGTMQRMDGLIASFTGEGEMDSSSKLRAFYREIGFAQFYQTPWLGMGMGNARILAFNTTGHDCYLHCNYAELAANGGIVGLTLYYWIFIYILVKEFKNVKQNRFALLLLLMILLQLVMDYGAVSYYSKTTYFLIMVAMLHIAHMRRSNNNRPKLRYA